MKLLNIFRRKKKKSEITKTDFIKEYGQTAFDEINTNDTSFKPNIPYLDNLTKEDQCHGKLKSGARCSRVIDNATYCWQHKLDRSG